MSRVRFNRLVLASLTLFLLASSVPTEATTPRERHDQCRYQAVDHRPGYSKAEIRDTMACAVRLYDVPGGFGTLVGIAWRESRLDPFAVNRYSGSCGLLQHLPSLWPGRVLAYRRAHPKARIGSSCFNARSAVVVSAWMMATSGLGPWR